MSRTLLIAGTAGCTGDVLFINAVRIRAPQTAPNNAQHARPAKHSRSGRNSQARESAGTAREGRFTA
ncbi:hypothetical protein GCM10010121_099180 [Streptomyces brasiliensis]|uniref:Uncharacterized protein n=1 Tax=Streptomyces brasiliensis TaxID=1954 RepID=A0A917PEJ6_9ACTN|nr:hypothetical protein GCM10010121_099180 [Streptomyces brasiliensis]